MYKHFNISVIILNICAITKEIKSIILNIAR